MARILEELLQEQTKTNAIQGTRPYLVSLQKTVASRVFRDMVAIQQTNNPEAQIFGLKYLTEDGQTLHDNNLTVTGANSKNKVKDLPVLSSGLSVTKDKVYRTPDNDAIYIAVKAGTLSADTDLSVVVLKAVIDGTLRLYSDAAEVSYTEGEAPIEAKFEIGKWVVPCRTRKIQIKLTQELIQDLEANGMDSVAIVEDTLATALVNEVNKDIISKLITVSKRFDDKALGITNGFIDLSTRTDPLWQIGRDINSMIGAAAAKMLQNTTYSATYVIVSPDVYGLLCGAGLVVFNQESEMTRSHGYLKSGLKIYIDTYSKFDYFVVGCKHNIDIAEAVSKDEEPEDEEYIPDDIIGSLYYCPYQEEDGSQIYVSRDPMSFHNNVLLMTRYALSVNPFIDQDEKINRGDDWNNLIGKQKLQMFVGIKLKSN